MSFFLRVVPFEGFLLVGVGRATVSIRADHPSPNEFVNLRLHSYEPRPRWSLHRTLKVVAAVPYQNVF